jgi:hypothetical protein
MEGTQTLPKMNRQWLFVGLSHTKCEGDKVIWIQIWWQRIACFFICRILGELQYYDILSKNIRLELLYNLPIII